MRLKFVLAAFALGSLLSGCATPVKMGLNKESTHVDVSKESLLLLTAKLSNAYKPSYQPEAYALQVEKQDADESAERFNFLADKEGTVKSPEGNEYVFRVSIPPGNYVIRGITGFSGIFPVRGNFFLPLHSDVTVTPQSVVYLGRVEGNVRERQDGEFRAGAPVPLIDQAVTGFSGGTFDVTITDSSDKDLAQLKTIFPALQTVEVQKNVLPPFDRARAQQWWEVH